MKIRILAVACLMLPALLFGLAGIGHAAQPCSPDGIAVSCFDGDTIKLQDRRIIRLAGIDAPEIGQNGKPAQYYSHYARKVLEDLTKGQKINMLFPGVKNRDQHGRLLADVRTEDGQSVNENLVSQGAAFFYPNINLSPDFQERLISLQADAIRERRGMWAHVLSLPVAKEHYCGNRATLRFYPADCQAVQAIKPHNRVHFGTLMDAFLAGYAPARICPFWPEESR